MIQLVIVLVIVLVKATVNTMTPGRSYKIYEATLLVSVTYYGGRNHMTSIGSKLTGDIFSEVQSEVTPGINRLV